MIIDKNFRNRLEHYLKDIVDPSIKIDAIKSLGSDSTKLLRYNMTFIVNCTVEEKKLNFIVRLPRKDIHDIYRAESIKDYFWQHFNSPLKFYGPQSINLGYLGKDRSLHSLSSFDTIFSIEEMISGDCYAEILQRRSCLPKMEKIDLIYANAIVGYLTNREKIIGSSARKIYFWDSVLLIKKLFIVIDSLYLSNQISEDEKCELEYKIIRIRQSMQKKKRPVVLGHNDFHPWNIMFTKDNALRLIDPEFPGLGEPARDIGILIPNLVYFSLLSRGNFSGMCREIALYLLDTYKDESKDNAVEEVIQPYITLACLILSNKYWFPKLSNEQRIHLKRIGINILDSKAFSIDKM